MANEDVFLYSIIVLIGIILGSLILLRFVLWLNRFLQNLKQIKNEIRRTRGGEKRYWIAQKRRLWLSILPFVKY